MDPTRFAPARQKERIECCSWCISLIHLVVSLVCILKRPPAYMSRSRRVCDCEWVRPSSPFILALEEQRNVSLERTASGRCVHFVSCHHISSVTGKSHSSPHAIAFRSSALVKAHVPKFMSIHPTLCAPMIVLYVHDLPECWSHASIESNFGFLRAVVCTLAYPCALNCDVLDLQEDWTDLNGASRFSIPCRQREMCAPKKTRPQVGTRKSKV